MTKINELEKEIRNIKRDPIPKRTDEEIYKLVGELISKMTLEEKVGQMYQSSFEGAAITGPEFDSSKVVDYIKKGRISSLIGLSDINQIYNLQKTAVEESRLGIPIIFAHDIIHGYKTSFPVNLAMSCSFDMQMIEDMAKTLAFESSRSGVNLTFSPMVDLVQDPRWGRVMESYGEDTYLGCKIAEAYVKGLQQDDLESYESIAACVKHYIGYGKSEAGRDYNTVELSDRTMRQSYLPQFKAAVDAGVAMVMTSFNSFDSIPVTHNKYLIRDVLRNDLGFDGVVISDYTSTNELIYHKTCRDEKEVAKKCIVAGLDIEMVGECYSDYLAELVNEGRINSELIDEAVKRVLYFKYKIGLFDNPYKNIYSNSEKYWLNDKTREKARDVSRKSIVMLKNDNSILPLNRESKESVALIGPFVDSKEVLGPWSGFAEERDCVTVLEGMNCQNSNLSIKYAKGCEVTTISQESLDEAIKISENVDKIILTLGEHQVMSGEAKSRTSISIPDAQIQLLEELSQLNKPIIVLLFNGRPLELNYVSEVASAILETWYLGTENGNAIADILFGVESPSAKLTMSFPRNTGQIPVYYNSFQTGRPFLANDPDLAYRSTYIDSANDPLYKFGFGLSYTEFEYSNIKISKNEMSKGEEVLVSALVRNVGNYCGEEIVQLYIEATCFSVIRPINELKGFKKIFLEKGESQKVTFTLRESDLAYYNCDMEYTPENTLFKIRIGGSSVSYLETDLKFNI